MTPTEGTAVSGGARRNAQPDSPPEGAVPRGTRSNCSGFIFDAIVLGGGRSKRMGRDKALLRLEAKPLLALAVEAALDGGAQRVAAVTPMTVLRSAFPEGVPPTVVQCLEDPPFGGPVAGIQAGLAALSSSAAGSTKPADFVGIFACDLAGAALAIPALAGVAPNYFVARPHEGAVFQQGEGDFHGVMAEDDTGRLQRLIGIYRRDFLTSRLALMGQMEGRDSGKVRNVSVYRLTETGKFVGVLMNAEMTFDVDTPMDVRKYKTLATSDAPEDSVEDATDVATNETPREIL